MLIVLVFYFTAPDVSIDFFLPGQYLKSLNQTSLSQWKSMVFDAN